MEKGVSDAGNVSVDQQPGPALGGVAASRVIPAGGINYASASALWGIGFWDAVKEINAMLVRGELETDPSRHGWFLPLQYEGKASKRGVNAKPAACMICGKPFEAKRNGNGWGKTCSIECRHVAMGKGKKHNKPPVARVCQVCGCEYRTQGEVCQARKCRNAMMGVVE